jgi:hypothetical protein
MAPFTRLLNLACGRPLPDEEDGRSRRLQLVAAALLASLVFAAIWGLAAGSSSSVLALANLYKLPMVVLLSALAAIPAGLLTWKLSGADCRATDLLLSFATAVFAGSLVLAVLSPLVALYYHSSTWAGPTLALGSVLLALTTAILLFGRGVWVKLPQSSRRYTVAPSVLVFTVVHLACLVQLVALASPILPEWTVFDGGLDAFLPR